MAMNTGNRPGYTLAGISIIIVCMIFFVTYVSPAVIGWVPITVVYLRNSKISAIKQIMYYIGVALEMYNKDWGFYPPGDGYMGWLMLKDELTGSKNALYNNPNNPESKTLTGKKGGIRYIDIETLNSLEQMIQNPKTSINYYEPVIASTGKSEYFLVVEEDCFWKKVRFTLKPGVSITTEFLP